METIGQFTIEGGYKIFTAGQLANISVLIGKNEISVEGGRVALAAGNILAAREAADRTRTKNGDNRVIGCLYTVGELADRTNLSERKVTSALEELEISGLLHFTESHIQIASDPLPQVTEEAEELIGSPGPNRPVPLPRTIIRGLSKLCRKRDKNAFMVGIACLLRALWVKKREKLIRYDGHILNATLMRVFGLCKRAIQRAKSKLKKMGLLLDHGRITRHGWRFIINLGWNKADERLRNQEQSSQEIEELRIQDKPKKPEVSPQEVPKGVEVSPLKNHITLNRNHNHKLDKSTKSVSNEVVDVCGVGFSKSYQQQKSQARGFWDVQAEELLTASGIEACYQRGIRVGVIKPSEMNRFSVFSAATSVVRRISADIGDCAKIFAAIVRNGVRTGCWTNISGADEDRARGLMNSLRNGQNAKTNVPVATAPQKAARRAMSPQEAQAEYERRQIERQKAIKAREQQIAVQKKRTNEEIKRDLDRLARIKQRNQEAAKAQNERFLASLDPEMRQKIIQAENRRKAKAAQAACARS